MFVASLTEPECFLIRRHSRPVVRTWQLLYDALFSVTLISLFALMTELIQLQRYSAVVLFRKLTKLSVLEQTHLILFHLSVQVEDAFEIAFTPLCRGIKHVLFSFSGMTKYGYMNMVCRVYLHLGCGYTQWL